MKHTRHYELDSRKEGERDPFAYIRNKLGVMAKRIGSLRISNWTRNVIAISEPTGRVTVGTHPLIVPRGECRELTVLSANLWHDWPRFRNIEQRLEAFAQLVEQESADVVLVQEIARTQTIMMDSWLAERLNMSYVYSRSNGSENIGFEEGLGIFSRFPLVKQPFIRQVSRLANPFVRRMALGVEVETPCGEILAFSVHLGLLRKQNAHQMQELRHWISRLSENRCVVIGGDFNAAEKSRQICHARTYWQDTYRLAQSRGHSHTHTVKWPWGGKLLSHRIDYIFLQPGNPGWKVNDVQHLDPPGGLFSDHKAVIARLTPA